MRKKFIIGVILAFGLSLNLVACTSNTAKEPNNIEISNESSSTENNVENTESSSSSSDIF